MVILTFNFLHDLNLTRYIKRREMPKSTNSRNKCKMPSTWGKLHRPTLILKRPGDIFNKGVFITFTIFAIVA